MAAILYFACHNTAIISHFKREGEISALAVSYSTILIFLTAVFASLISYVLNNMGHVSLYYYATYTCSTLLTITSVLLFLYVPKVSFNNYNQLLYFKSLIVLVNIQR